MDMRFKTIKVKLFCVLFCFLFSTSLFSYYKPNKNGITFVLNGVEVSLVLGNITKQHDVDAVINAANQHLKKGGGVCGAIFSSAGQQCEIACINLLNNFKDKKAPVGTVVVTDGGDLETSIIHVVAPNFNPTNFIQKSILFNDIGKNLLEKAYFNLLSLAIDKGFEKIAIPFLSGGNFCRVPSDRNELAAIALESVFDFCKNKMKHGTLKEVRFVLYDMKDFELFANELDTLVS